MAKIIELILTEERVGAGKEGDPVRLCPQLWTKDGKLVAMRDSVKKEDSFYPESLGK